MKQKFQRFLALLVLAFVGIGAAWAGMPDNLWMRGHIDGQTSWKYNHPFTCKNTNLNQYVFEIKINADSGWGYGSFVFPLAWDSSEESVDGSCLGADKQWTDNTSATDKEIKLNETKDLVSLNDQNYGKKVTGYFITGGTYQFVVDFSKDTPTVTVKTSKSPLPGNANDWKTPEGNVYNDGTTTTVTVPKDLWLVGHIGGYSAWGAGKKATKVSDDVFEFNDVRFVGWSNSEYSTFAFSTIGTGKSDPYYGRNGDDYGIYDGTTHNDMTKVSSGGWKVNNKDGIYKIVVDFSNPEAPFYTMEKTAEYREPFYFVGDMNDWFSNEFSDPRYESGSFYKLSEGGKIEDGIVKEGVCEYSPNDGTWQVKAGMFDAAEKQMVDWEFTYVGELDGVAGNWYKFDGFPNGVMTGQFKIWDGKIGDGGWDNAYSNAKSIDGAGSRNPSWNNYTDYINNPITRQNISEGKVLGSEMIKKGHGQNLFLECGAVKDATIYFNPDGNGQIKITGTPIDYYIFYGLSDDGTATKREVYKDGVKKTLDEDWVRAKITADKPNVNNYFLPGIWYGEKLSDVKEDDDHKALDGSGKYFAKDVRMPLPAAKWVDGKRVCEGHMNMPDRALDKGGVDLGGQDLVRIKIKGAKDDDIKAELQKIMDSTYSTADPESNEKIIERIVNEKTLPDGRYVGDYDYIWIQKIPSGFEAPAGKSYTLSFNKSRNSYTKDAVYTIRPEHMYFFNGEPAHLHVDYSDVARFFNVKVEYRVFTYDAKANVVVASPDHNAESSKVIYNTNQTALQPTEKETGDRKDYGWVELKDKGNCHQQWCNGIHTHEEVSLDNYNWNYKAHAVTRATDADTDVRHAVNQKYGKASIQLKVTYTKKDGVDYNETAWKNPPAGFLNGDPVVFYTPAVLNPDNIDPRLRFDMKDKYLVMKADDPVMTGIEDITIEDVDFDTDSDATPVYYNLQGVRVANPSNGIFIEVRGSKSSKVYIK